MSKPKPIVVIPLEAEGVVHKLEEAGYVVIVSEQPERIRVLDMVPVATLGAVARAAYETIRGSDYSSTQAKFGEAVARNMLVAAEAADE